MKLVIDRLTATLGDMSFEYRADIDGGIFGIFGISGSGKSTLMNLICGITPADSGKIVFNETLFFDSEKGINLPAHRRRVGVVFQEHHIFPHLSVKQNLTFGLKFTRHRHISFDDVVSLLDLQPLLGKVPSCLSGGERQRVAIGRALLQQPGLLLLDEPFSNLDRSRRAQIISYLLQIHHQFEIPLLIISHDLEDILKMTQRLIIVENKSILASGHFLEIVESGIVPHLISPRKFINIVELVHQRYVPRTRLNFFGKEADGDSLIITNSSHFTNEQHRGCRVRLAIAPDDIALASDTCSAISMQNQLRGKVTHILHMNDSFFVTLDCGVTLISEITPSALYQLDVKPGSELVCLFKAKAIEIIHVFQ